MAEGLAARLAAVELLGAVLGDGRMLSDLDLPTELPPQECARALRLALAVLRRVGPIDALLSPHLRKVPPMPAMNALRLAVAEQAMGAAAHGAVNSAVEIVRRGRRTGHLTGLVNAVLRALPEGRLLEGAPDQKLPRWMRQPMVHAWGREAVAAMEAVQASEPPLDLTLRQGREAPAGGEPLPTGSVRMHHAGQVSALPGYAAGDWWVQDMAATLAVQLLQPQPGERVLDLCAAPGGKTMQLADAGAAVVALDISGPRMARVAENLARTGLSAEMVVADALAWAPDLPFDAVLLDAPCSATGTVRRHPDLPFIKDGSELPGLVTLQGALLDRALGWLKPGGRLVFCTCSLLPEEGEGQLASALSRHPGLMVEQVLPEGAAPEWQAAGGGLRLRPDYLKERGGMDGFFMVRLRI